MDLDQIKEQVTTEIMDLDQAKETAYELIENMDLDDPEVKRLKKNFRVFLRRHRNGSPVKVRSKKKSKGSAKPRPKKEPPPPHQVSGYCDGCGKLKPEAQIQLMVPDEGHMGNYCRSCRKDRSDLTIYEYFIANRN